jgi:hypothetical protein
MQQPGSIGVPEDGYGYMDDEQYIKLTTATGTLEVNPGFFYLIQVRSVNKGVQMECYSRNLGFGPTDAICTIKRKRFRIHQHPELQLLHYVKADTGRAPVQAHLIKQRPRATARPAMERKNKIQQHLVVENNVGDDLDYRV